MQSDLDVVLLQVQKELKKRMFPRKHIKLLWNEVVIGTNEMDRKTLGVYETVDNKENKYRFIHRITINNYVYKEYKSGVAGIGICKRYTKKRFKDTIAHELLHAYVYEKYEFCDYDYNYHNDGSPIFLSMLVFLNIPSGHKSMAAFRHTQLYKKIKEYDSFENLEKYLIHLTGEYEKEFRRLSQMIEANKVYVNSFSFSGGDITGVKGRSTSAFMYHGNICKANTFVLGANVDLNNLKVLVMSKINRNVFENKYISEDCCSIDGKRSRIKLQSMNI